MKVNRNAAQLLVEKLGTGLDRLDMELAKLASFVGLGKTVKRELVVDMVGLSREEEAWILQEAMATGNANAALGKLRELLDVSRHNEVPLMWGVIDLTRKLYASSMLMRRGMSVLKKSFLKRFCSATPISRDTFVLSAIVCTAPSTRSFLCPIR